MSCSASLSSRIVIAVALLTPACGLNTLGKNPTAGATTDDAGTTDTEVTNAATDYTTSTVTDAGTTDPTNDNGTSDDETIEGHPTTSPTTGGTGLSFASDIWEPIFRLGCSCHEGSPSGGLLMGSDAASAYASMVSVPSSIGLNYVTAGSSSQSYVFHKVNDSQNDVGGAGNRMPLGAPSLDPSEIDTIKAWIDAGAAQ